MRLHFLVILCPLICLSCQPSLRIEGELRQWHKVELIIDGPSALESDRINPFLDYRLQTTFTQGNSSIVVPGFFAADGRAAESSAEGGNKWIVRFRPATTGTWQYTVSLRKGKNIALSSDPDAGEPAEGDELTGELDVLPSDKAAPDFRAKGRVQPAGHYLKFSGSDEYFLKGGADSPENFLAFVDFDQTYRYGDKAIEREGEANPKESIHRYAPHLQDWKEGDPTWQGGKGKAMIGALNYLASKGVNAQYMLTLNIQGDGQDVWPYTDHNERYRFDCSKLDQWEIVFDHMESIGMMLHFVLQETENENLLDGGHTQVQRRLYLRELVARFGHHLAVTWNLGEENGPANFSPVGQTDQMRKDMATFLKEVNPYPSFVVLHTHSTNHGQEETLVPLLGFAHLDGPSMQVSRPVNINDRISHFRAASANAGHPWVVCLDELGPHWQGIMPDATDPTHDTVRHQALWGSLLAGAAGVEWYFGYRHPHNDLNCEDFRSRDAWWDQTKIALDFFRRHVPFDEMTPANALVGGGGTYCFAAPGRVYAIYRPIERGPVDLDLRETTGRYAIQWYDPRAGGDLQTGSVLQVDAGARRTLGDPPSDAGRDWVVLVTRQ